MDQNLIVEILDKMSALITAAFGLVAALAWNGAIQAIFTQYFPAGTGILPNLIYAILVTLIAVIAVIYIGRAAGRAKERAGVTSGSPA
jgi:hypothetical protein